MNPKKLILSPEFPSSGNKYPVNHWNDFMAKAVIGRAGFMGAIGVKAHSLSTNALFFTFLSFPSLGEFFHAPFIF